MRMKEAMLLALMAQVVVAFGGVRQVFRQERFLRGDENVRAVQPIDSAAWIWEKAAPRWAEACMGSGARKRRDVFAPRFLRFRKTFSSTGVPLRIDVSADERFILLLDGAEIARGPHRGMPERWFYHSYEIGLEAGEHALEAIVWQMGAHAPLAQLSWRGGFILKAEGRYDEQLTTGKAAWQVGALTNTTMTGQGESRAWGVGSECTVAGTALLDERPMAYRPAVVVRGPIGGGVCGLRQSGWMLFPSALPDQMHERRTPGRFKAVRADSATPFAAADSAHLQVKALNALLREGLPVTLPPHTTLRAVWDLENYYCAYPEMTVSGGKEAKIRWRWAESLLDGKGRKGDRAAFEGKKIGKAFGDVFRPDGRPDGRFTTPWWRCGRWCQLDVSTEDEPLTVNALAIVETRYPTEPQAFFVCDDPAIPDVRRICIRALQMCSHEMFFDCPYYEQQMYPGDTRVQMRTTATLHADSRLVRQAMTLLGEAQRPNGLVPMNYPSRMMQESVTYTLCWVAMFRDFMMWRDDEAWLRARAPGMRRALDGVAAFVTPEGLLGALPGWSFIDYTVPWPHGLPPRGQKDGFSAPENLQYLYALRCAAEVERALGERHLADRWSEQTETLAARIRERFWCAARGMLADTSDRDAFSEQTQSLAILAEALEPGQRAAAMRGLEHPDGLTPATVYFSHDLFEAYFACGRSDLFFRRLDLWRRYVALNMSTLQEMPETPARDPRSDCHAWGAHPLYHLQANVAGVRPGSPFFRSVRVAPQPGPLGFIRAGTPTPHGLVEEELRFADGEVRGTVTLPEGMDGMFVWKGRSIPLRPGMNAIPGRDGGTLACGGCATDAQKPNPTLGDL